MAQSTKYPRYKTTDQQSSLRNRLPIVGGVMVVATLYLIVQLVTFQYQTAYVTSYYNRLAPFNYSQSERIAEIQGYIVKQGHVRSNSFSMSESFSSI